MAHERPASHRQRPAIRRGGAYSPDGGKIVFDTDRDPETEADEIYKMDSDGSTERRVTDNDVDDAEPSWGVR